MSPLSAKQNKEQRMNIRLAESLTATSNNCDNFCTSWLGIKPIYLFFGYGDDIIYVEYICW